MTIRKLLICILQPFQITWCQPLFFKTSPFLPEAASNQVPAVIISHEVGIVTVMKKQLFPLNKSNSRNWERVEICFGKMFTKRSRSETGSRAIGSYTIGLHVLLDTVMEKMKMQFRALHRRQNPAQRHVD